MIETEVNDELRASLDNIKAWLAGRQGPDPEIEKATITAPDGLRSIGFADLTLEKVGPHHLDGVVYSQENEKPKNWTELSHLVEWSKEFLNVLENNKQTLAALELIRGLNEYPISLARYHVEEAIDVVKTALEFEVGLDLQHPDTRAQNYALDNVLIEDSAGLHDIVKRVFTCLFSKCLVRLVVKTSNFHSAALSAYLVDLMYRSGASTSEVGCIAFDRRESLGSERFSKCVASSKYSKLSIVAAVFKQTDTFAAAQGIIESYFREQSRNLIILVEESAYDRFVKDWQRYYSHAIHIGSRLDNRTTVVDTFNEKVQVELAAIDMKASHKMTGNVINVLKFRTLNEFLTLLGSLRKIPYMTVWNDDIILCREFCLRINQCQEFWINHVPKGLSGRHFPEDLLNFYSETVAPDMTNIYNSVYTEFLDEAEHLRKVQSVFLKKDDRLRTFLIIQAYIAAITKSKSLRNGGTIGESVARLKRFQQGSLQKSSVQEGSSRIEYISKPVGMAIMLVREDSVIKSKSVLLEFIFKNLLIGNAVLLVCPTGTLGAKFVLDNSHVIPFKMVHESVPDISRLSLDSSPAGPDTSFSKKQCPKNTYALEILPEMNSESCETITVALGIRSKSIWYPSVDQLNYWSNE